MTQRMLRSPNSLLQDCPLCGQRQEIYVRGTAKNPENPATAVVTNDRGYSFCNCNNIFFTSWSNMKTGIYDHDYFKNYDSEVVRKYYDFYWQRYWPLLQEFNPSLQTFLDVGCVNEYLLDLAQLSGLKTTGMDVIRTPRRHDFIEGNFEDTETGKFDCIWLSHVFEHFKDPREAVRKIHRSLNDKGIVFLATPDTFAIDWNNPYTWGHWHVNEHHILWDMESLINFFDGFECLYKYRNPSKDFICTGDFHVIFQKR